MEEIINNIEADLKDLERVLSTDDLIILDNLKSSVEELKKRLFKPVKVKKDYDYTEEKKLINSVWKYFDKDVRDKLTKVKLQKWLDEIRKLRELDKFELDVIKDVIIFGRQDEFWSKNFLSIASLRKEGKDGVSKFIKIKKKMEKNKKPQSNYKEELNKYIDK